MRWERYKLRPKGADLIYYMCSVYVKVKGIMCKRIEWVTVKITFILLIKSNLCFSFHFCFSSAFINVSFYILLTFHAHFVCYQQKKENWIRKPIGLRTFRAWNLIDTCKCILFCVPINASCYELGNNYYEWTTIVLRFDSLNSSK